MQKSRSNTSSQTSTGVNKPFFFFQNKFVSLPHLSSSHRNSSPDRKSRGGEKKKKKKKKRTRLVRIQQMAWVEERDESESYTKEGLADDSFCFAGQIHLNSTQPPASPAGRR
ncbi:hypothetical protein CEXT_125271 [Caerostris extrusa]|uniref:Uncharacterized protein n=1 Tax=Caerostris extrusa TaxID=172846 RepID=A0AAV4TCS9_CAEEX|nr:hypothetical protein CEXT_125271 [Caerostris extrusa]